MDGRGRPYQTLFGFQEPKGKENMAPSGWESHLDRSLVERSKQEILTLLNTGSHKDLKGLQLIGDKKAKLILGWREIYGSFTKVRAAPRATCYTNSCECDWLLQAVL
jgi:hypothetical protein